MFDEKTIQQLKSYVYMLIDPVSTKPFYIGKGTRNRVFDHISCTIDDSETEDIKYDIIRKITDNGGAVGHIIVRHGLSEDEALQIEASLIDAFRFTNALLSNKATGHKSIEKGLMTSDEIKRLYNAEPLNELRPDCILININKNYKRGLGVTAIYEATKGIWTINKKHLTSRSGEILRKYVLSEYRGLVVEVFEVMSWNSEERGFNPAAKKYGQKRSGISFEGRVADDDIRNLYINKSVAHHKKQGAAIAHRLKL